MEALSSSRRQQHRGLQRHAPENASTTARYVPVSDIVDTL